MKLRIALALLLGLATFVASIPSLAQEPPGAATNVPSSDLTPPELLRNVEPVYPPEALRDRRTAEVLLLLDIDAEGNVTAATVKTPVGFGFEEAAVAAAQQLKFKPATKKGKNIPSRILYRSKFELTEAPPPAQSVAAPVKPTSTLSGTVKIAEVDAPLAGAQVVVTLADRRILRTTADASGQWKFAGVASGKVKVRVQATGYEPYEYEELVAAGESVDVVYRLHIAPQALEVRVRGERPDREVTKRVMTRQELSLVPGTGGDALAAMQSLPGVARAQAFSGMLIVRGSPPHGTGVFVNGVELPRAYHFGGLSSTIPTEMIEAIDFYPGNFSARYGRFLGGVLELRLRELPQDGKYRGLAQVDFIDARVMLSGPIPLLKGWSFSLAGRRSHLDAWIGSVMGDAFTLRKAPVYYDWQAFAETKPTTKSLFRIGVFGSDDRISMLFDDAIPQDPGLGTSMADIDSSLRVQSVYRNELSSSVKLSATVAAGADRDRITFGSLQADTLYRPVTIRGDLEWKPSSALTLRAGPDMIFTNFRGELRTTLPPDSSQPDPGPMSTRPLISWKGSGWVSMPGAFAELEWLPDARVKFLYGGRVDYNEMTGRADVSPRFNARYDLHKGFPRTTLKTGVGLFHEPPQPVEAFDVFGTPHLRSNRAIHYSLGAEQEIAEAVDLSLEGFYKDLDNLVVREGQADGSFGYNNLGKGRVYGAEVLLRHRAQGRFFGWLAYTIMRSERTDAPGEPSHLFEYDQTHLLTALASYELGRGWRVGGRFRLVSGNPYTPCLGGVQNAGTGTYLCRSGPLFSARVPPFHQADVRVDKTWKFTAWSLTTYLDVQNVYNRSNPEGIEYNYNYTRTRYQAGLPILPSLGLRGEF